MSGDTPRPAAMNDPTQTPPKSPVADRASAGLGSRFETLRETYRQGLLADVIPFWTRYGVDRDQGGFLSCLDRDGTVVDFDKGIWQQGRFAWLFGELYNTVRADPEWLTLCRHGIEFLDRHAFDPADGRMWFHVARDGTPIRKRRYAFSEAFAALAYGEYAQATGDAAYAEKAERLALRFLRHESSGDYRPKFTDRRPTRGIGVPMIAIHLCQELRESISLRGANERIDESIDTIRRLFLKPELRCVMETVGPEGQVLDHFDTRTLNPGHAIEGAWFILEEGRYRRDGSLIEMGCRMLRWMWDRGWDRGHGGIYSLRDVFAKPVQEYWHDMKFWWPHNETVIATLLAYELTGDGRYREMHGQVHDWAYRHFPDPEHGEWFGYLHRDGSRSSDLKGNLWKGMYHLPRMQLVCWRILDRLGSQSLSEKGSDPLWISS